MGSKAPKTPPPPDPYATASAQTSSNVQTAIANSWLGNANTYSPTGQVEYNQIGTAQITGPQGETYDIPRFSSTTKLSPEQQKLYDQQTALGSSLNTLAQEQTNRLGQTLNSPINSASWSPAVNSVGAGPSFVSGPAAPSLATTFGDAGAIQRSIDLDNKAATTFGGTAGNIQYDVGAKDFANDRQSVEDALYARVNPQLDRDRSALESRLAAQGVTPGSAAYREAMGGLDRAATDTRMQVTAAGGQEQSRLFGMDLQKGQFNNAAQAADFGQQQARGMFNLGAIGQNNAATSAMGEFANAAQNQNYGQLLGRATFSNDALNQNFANGQSAAGFENNNRQLSFGNTLQAATFANTSRERQMQEEIALRNQPINEISTLMNGGQVTMPQFAAYQGGTVAGTPVGQYVYQSAQMAADAAKAKAAASASTAGGLFGLGSSALSALGSFGGTTAGSAALAGLFGSDRRIKRDIRRIGRRGRLNVYGYTYAGEPNVTRIGFMADEVAKVSPKAVISINGILHVDYSKVAA